MARHNANSLAGTKRLRQGLTLHKAAQSVTIAPDRQLIEEPVMKESLAGLLVGSALCFGSAAHAADAEFLKSLEGNWAGKGSVKVNADSSPVNVSCKFASDTTESSMSLDGECTGLVVISRDIGARLKTDGKSYTGTYIGSRTGPAGLSGKRSGNALNLGIRWAKDVNGDRSAKLRLEKVGDNGMRLTTVDTDPATGKSVVISDINLRRL
jgi:hypothetical protein